MAINLTDYQALVFDCDGVILNSNPLKTEAFFHVGLSHGREAAEALADYNARNGGISRYVKFRHFLDEIVEEPDTGPGYDELVEHYAQIVREGLVRCEIASGLDVLRETTRDARWLVVSGGDQEELREVFQSRELNSLFDGGIYGSPDTKDEILDAQVQGGIVSFPALFLGDSLEDCRAASDAGLDFVFVGGWSEVPNCREYCEKAGIRFVWHLHELIDSYEEQEETFNRP